MRRLARRPGALLGPIRTVVEALSELIAVIRALAVNLALIAGVVVGIVVVMGELSRPTLVLEPIRVPPRLAAIGYSPESAARLLKEEIGAIRRQSRTVKELQGLAGEWELPDVQIPETETTLRQVLNHLRDILERPETRIAGDIVGDDALGYTLRLWDPDAGPIGTVEEVAADAVPELFREGAIRVMTHAEPYVLALYLSLLGNSEGTSDRVIEDLIAASLANDRADDDPWAHNLQGLVLERRGEHAAALAAYEKAIDLDEEFVIAHINRAQALARLGRVFDERAAYAEAEAYGRNLDYLHYYWGMSHYRQREYRQAAERLEQSIALNDAHAPSFTNAGLALYRLRCHAPALARFERALRLDPAAAAAVLGRARVLYDQSDAAAALDGFRAAADAGAAFVAEDRLKFGCLLHAQGDEAAARLAWEAAQGEDRRAALLLDGAQPGVRERLCRALASRPADPASCPGAGP